MVNDRQEESDPDQGKREQSGPKETLSGVEKIIFWVGLFFFWPVLIFVRRDAGSEYFSGEELRTPLIILWIILLITSFGVVYVVEYPLAEYFSHGASTTGLTVFETVLYYCYTFLKPWVVYLPVLIGVVTWILLDPWKRSYLNSHTLE